MAFEPSFTVGILSDVTSIQFTDTSTDSDPAITTRYIYIQLADNSYLKPPGGTTDYIEWPLSDGLTKIIADILNIDYAANVTVQWRDEAGALYESTEVANVPPHALYAGWQMLTRLSINPALVNKADFWKDYCKLFTLIQASNDAVAAGGDITGAQLGLNISTQLINTQLGYY